MVLENAAALIFAAACGFSIVSQLLNIKMGIKKRTKEIQDEIKGFQEEFKKASEKNDEVALKKLKAREEQVMGMMQEMMLLPWKSMIFVMPMFFLLIGEPFLTHYPGFLMEAFKGFVIFLPFDLHVDAVFSLQIIREAAYGPKGFFIVSTLFTGMLYSVLEPKVAKIFQKKQ
ncbi:MAG: EMC3/TMCO1 family protein [Candidatus Micrarchaeia archaeon]|jgi:uncharacterized membrane protein (DUF106 family)